MNRRAFFATLLAPLVAWLLPKRRFNPIVIWRDRLVKYGGITRPDIKGVATFDDFRSFGSNIRVIERLS